MEKERSRERLYAAGAARGGPEWAGEESLRLSFYSIFDAVDGSRLQARSVLISVRTFPALRGRPCLVNPTGIDGNQNVPQGLNRLRKKGEQRANRVCKRPAGAKAHVHFATLAARLKSCPDTSCPFRGVFPQPVKPDLIFQLLAARPKSCPDTSCLSRRVFPKAVKPHRVGDADARRNFPVAMPQELW